MFCKKFQLQGFGLKKVGIDGVKVLEFFNCPGPLQGVHRVHDEKYVWFEVELQGAQGDREAKVFLVNNDDTALAQRGLEDKQPEEKRSIQQCMKSRVAKHLGVAGIQQKNGFVNETNVTLFAKEQHSAWELFSYREDNNEAAFAVAAVDKIYAHEILNFNNTVAREVILKWEAGLKDDMDARSDVYMLSNDDMAFSCGCKVEIRVTKGLLVKARGNILGMEIIKDQSGNTLRVSQSRIHNEKLVFMVFDYAIGRSIIVMSRSITGYELMIVGCVGSLKANLQHMEALSTTKARYVTFTEAWKKEIWLKGLLTESRYELRLVAGIATSALVKGCSQSEVPAQVKVAAYQY
nr:zinc finger, CCHC-type [Tanacetum cinerariifolium]